MKLLGYIIAWLLGLYLVINLVGMARAYPITDTVTIDAIACTLDAKSLVTVSSGDTSTGVSVVEDVAMDMLTFYCQIHAGFQGDQYLIAYRSPTPPKRGSIGLGTLIDEYTLILDEDSFHPHSM